MIIKKTTAALYTAYTDQLRRVADLRCANAVLQWDQETYLPKNGADFRGQQLATVGELAHQFFTAATVGDLLQELGSREDLDSVQKKNITLSAYDYSKAVKLPATFVRRMSEQVTKSYHAWVGARNQNSFGVFKPELEKLVVLKKQEADLLGYEGHAYNALLNEYERGSTVQWLDGVFGKLLQPLKSLVKDVTAKQTPVRNPLAQFFPKDLQWAFCNDLLQLMGFDFDSGRQDLSEHPFTTSFSPQDVRITTRIDENNLGYMTWSTLHELGHAWYEQGLPALQYGLPLGEACSLSIHESQSRLWENGIGRSPAFCEWLLPVIARHFPIQMKDVTPEQLYQSLNIVTPSLIRTEADELTYHFHVMIRYQIEKRIMAGDLQVGDIPILWNELYSEYLGVKVPDDKNGCLQDIHWSHGSFGYFPTYSLGSLYAVQLLNRIGAEVPDMDDKLSAGSFEPVLAWLRSNVHKQGRSMESDELCKFLCEQGLETNLFIRYGRSKFLP
ncbi:MAG: carboxypeptidase M32 [Chitinophagaceae bacterium]